MKSEPKVYISGDRGMVGKNLIEHLAQKEGYKLITRSSKELDLRDQSAVSRFFKVEKPDYVIHLAARVGGIMANIEHNAEFFYENLMIGANIIHAAYENGVRKLLNLGSSCMYPRECPQPMREEYLLNGKPEVTNEGYAIAKIVGVKLCQIYRRQYRVNFFSLIPPNLYGPHERFDSTQSHVIAGLTMKFHRAKMEAAPSIQLWGSGRARREFLFIKDLVEAIDFFITNQSTKSFEQGYINVGTGEDISIADLAEKIKKTVGYTGKIEWDTSHPDGMPQKLMDVSKMKSYDWTPRTSLEEGLKKIYNYYLSTLY